MSLIVSVLEAYWAQLCLVFDEKNTKNMIPCSNYCLEILQ